MSPKIKNKEQKKIDEVIQDGLVEYTKKTFLKKVLEFFVKHGVHINTLLIVSLIILSVWYGRPIYDRFHKLPNDIEAAQKINNKQDSVVRSLTYKIERLNREYAEKFKALDDNIHLLIKYRNANAQLLNDLVKRNSEVTTRLMKTNNTTTMMTPINYVEDTIQIKKDTIR